MYILQTLCLLSLPSLPSVKLNADIFFPMQCCSKAIAENQQGCDIRELLMQLLQKAVYCFTFGSTQK